MAGHDPIRGRRELVQRLVLAELLARPGRGPLALRVVRPRASMPPAHVAPELSEPEREGEP